MTDTRVCDEAVLETIQHELNGSCTPLCRIIDSHELSTSEEDLRDRLLDEPHPVEACVVCSWWHSPTDLEFDESRNGGVCWQCDPDAFD